MIPSLEELYTDDDIRRMALAKGLVIPEEATGIKVLDGCQHEVVGVQKILVPRESANPWRWPIYLHAEEAIVASYKYVVWKIDGERFGARVRVA